MTYTIFNTFRPYDFGTDAIERQRVSLGQSIIDADFEYGLQGTKWQSYQEVLKTPGFFENPGTDIAVTSVISDGASPQSLISVVTNPPPTSNIAAGTAPANSFGIVNNFIIKDGTVINQTITNSGGINISNQEAYVNLQVNHYIMTGTTFLVEIAGTAGGTGTLNGIYTATATNDSQYRIVVPTATATGNFTTQGTTKFLTAIGFLWSSGNGIRNNGSFVVGPTAHQIAVSVGGAALTNINNSIQGIVTLTNWNGFRGTLNYSNQTWLASIPGSAYLFLRSGFTLQQDIKSQNFGITNYPYGGTTYEIVRQTIQNSSTNFTASASMQVTLQQNHYISTTDNANFRFLIELSGVTPVGTATGTINGIYSARSDGNSQYTIDATQYGASGTFNFTGSTTKFLTHIGIRANSIDSNRYQTYGFNVTFQVNPTFTNFNMTTYYQTIGSTNAVTIFNAGNSLLNGSYGVVNYAESAFTMLAPVGVPNANYSGNILIGLPAAVPTLGAFISGPVTALYYNGSDALTVSYQNQTWLQPTIPAGTRFVTVSAATPGTQPYTANVVSVSGLINTTKTADRAEGFFPLAGITTNSALAYYAKGVVPAGQISTSYTVMRRGGLFNNGNSRIQGIISLTQTIGPNRVTVTTASAHGLVPGTPIAAFGWTSPGDAVNGNFFLESVPTPTTFTYVPRVPMTIPASNGSGTVVIPPIFNGFICVQTYSSTVHRPFDGGVLLAAGQPTYGSSIVRQSKKVFRYQSGKGLLWSSGTLFAPNNDIVAMSSAGTAIGSLTAIVSEIANGLPQAGASVQIVGVASTGFNTVGTSFYTINNVIESTTASMLSLNTISGVTPVTASIVSMFGSGASTQTFTITVLNPGIGSIFLVDGVQKPVLTLVRGGVYTFNQTAASNSGQQIGFKNAAGAVYTTGVVISGSPGSTGITTFTVPQDAPVQLRYYSSGSGSDFLGNTITIVDIPARPTVTVNTLPQSGIASILGNGTTVTVNTGSAGIANINGNGSIVTVNTQSIGISSITGNGTTVTVTTSGNHLFTSGVGIAITSTTNYNTPVGVVFPITVTGVTTFTYLSTVNAGTQSGAGTVTSPHGLTPGVGVVIAGTTSYNTSANTANVLTTPSTTQFTFASTVNVGTQTGGTATSPHGLTVGNSIVISGTTNYNRTNVVVATTPSTTQFTYTATTIGLSSIGIVTPHVLRSGLAVAITGTTNYNTAGAVITLTSPTQFTFLSTATGASSTGTATSYVATLSDQPRFIMKTWHGASVRAGCFDDQNGLFWEYDGQTLFVVKRSATFQLSGLVSCSFLSQTLTGDANTRFQDQIRVSDRFVMRGMTHTVTSITSQNTLTFNPPYRGATEITTAVPARISKVKELRVPQSQFNRDKLDGTGSSAFTVNTAKMQMIGLQYTWYGAGFVDFMMRGLDGNWVYAHRFYNNNVNDEAYMRTGNMPVRYELVNECSSAISTLGADLGNAVTASLTLTDDPTAYWPTAGTVQIDNEMIAYTGKTSSTLTGLTRSASLTYNIADTNRTFTGSTTSGGDVHAIGATVNLVSTTCTPSLTHWGSALLMDGEFDSDRGYFFNYTFNQTTSIATNVSLPLFFIRLAPSASNGIVGDIGARDLLNRAQLLLQKLDCSVVGGQSTLNINGILNPVGFENSTFNWLNINTLGQGSQPSFTQFCNYSNVVANGGIYSPGSGERIFSLIAQGGSVSTIDLSALKELSNTVIGGNRMFPDGPDTLMIVATPLYTSITSAVLNLYWTEAQA